MMNAGLKRPSAVIGHNALLFLSTSLVINNDYDIASHRESVTGLTQFAGIIGLPKDAFNSIQARVDFLS